MTDVQTPVPPSVVGFVALFSIISTDSQGCFHFDRLFVPREITSGWQNKTYLWRKPGRDWWWFSHWSYCFEWWWWYEYWILMMSLGVAGNQTLASARCRCCSSDDGRNLTNIGKRNRRFLCWLLADPALGLEEAEAGDGHHLQTQIGTYVQYTSAAWKRTKRALI